MTQIPESELILNKDGSVYHLNLLPEEISDIIINVGDPDRVRLGLHQGSDGTAEGPVGTGGIDPGESPVEARHPGGGSASQAIAKGSGQCACGDSAVEGGIGTPDGLVDEFDGLFQSLHLESGPHRVEVRAPGYETLAFEVRLIPDHTTTYTGELKKLQK